MEMKRLLDNLDGLGENVEDVFRHGLASSKHNYLQLHKRQL